jgi:hypothetical protein
MKRNKKYNKMKGALAFARLGLKDLAVWHDEKSDAEYTSEIINYKRCRSIDIGLSMINAIIKVKHKWNIHLIAIGHESNGKRRFEVQEHAISEPLLQSQLVDYLNAVHAEFAEKFATRNTLTNVAWLAVPNGDTITTEQVEAVISYKDAW